MSARTTARRYSSPLAHAALLAVLAAAVWHMTVTYHPEMGAPIGLGLAQMLVGALGLPWTWSVLFAPAESTDLWGEMSWDEGGITLTTIAYFMWGAAVLNLVLHALLVAVLARRQDHRARARGAP